MTGTYLLAGWRPDGDRRPALRSNSSTSHSDCAPCNLPRFSESRAESFNQQSYARHHPPRIQPDYGQADDKSQASSRSCACPCWAAPLPPTRNTLPLKNRKPVLVFSSAVVVDVYPLEVRRRAPTIIIRQTPGIHEADHARRAALTRRH